MPTPIDCPLCWRRAVPSATLSGGRVRCGHCHAAIPAHGGSPLVVGRRRRSRKSRPRSAPPAFDLGALKETLALHKRPLAVAAAVVVGICVYAFCPFHLLELYGQPPVYPARGEVAFEGRPLANASIVLHPLSGPADAPRPRATADAQGRFVLTAGPNVNGVPAGDYAVAVLCYPPPSGKDENAAPRNLLPERYARPETSGLTLRIEPGDNQLAPLRLKR